MERQDDEGELGAQLSYVLWFEHNVKKGREVKRAGCGEIKESREFWKGRKKGGREVMAGKGRKA